ncbi:MAG TPA: ECF-type sigma factor [Terriglobales bacterium]|jgi:RNA polymerase sigma factor (TIGR02999 family)
MPSAGANPTQDAAFAETYQTLRGLADSYMRRFAGAATLQATALVHEAYLKLIGNSRPYADEAHFIRTAAMAMRQILVDHARARQSQKRGKGDTHLTLDGLDLAQPAGIDVLLLNDALRRLEEWDRQQAQIVELRCFIGLSVPETALNLQISEATVKRDWAMARAWLQRELEVK